VNFTFSNDTVSFAKQKKVRAPIKSAAILTGILLLFTASRINKKGDEWKAPPEADKILNPLKGNAAASVAGKGLYVQFCVVCHGDKGKGDGIAGISLNPRPANHAGQKVQSQTDGAIFWKITTGRPPMASYKGSLTETQRWQLVNYIRELGKHK
jgi:mono/diheme cytochrome c family protein